jgi:hypothetical protein
MAAELRRLKAGRRNRDAALAVYALVDGRGRGLAGKGADKPGLSLAVTLYWVRLHDARGDGKSRAAAARMKRRQQMTAR